MNNKILILGAGISGLSTAYWLHKAGYNVTILEKNHQPGGAMISRNIDGFMIDYGPNSGLETSPLIRKIAEDVGLSDEMIYANEEGNKRYILRDGALHALPTSPPAFIKTKLFSGKAKLRLMMEPFIGKSNDGYYQSIAQFVRRRLGQEFLDYAINPFVAGVFAGNPDDLSVKSAFPKLYRLEEVYGGLIKGMIKGARERKRSAEKAKSHAKMFSFRRGMQSFPESIAGQLSDKIHYNTCVKTVTHDGNEYKVNFLIDNKLLEIKTDVLISTVPAYIAAEVFDDFDGILSNHLKAVYYPPVMVLYLGYKKDAVGQPLDGFGFLIPQKEKRSFLGAIWSSVIFSERSPEDLAAFTLFIGGARSPELFHIPKDELMKKVLNEFSDIMKIKGEPVFLQDMLWDKAIPQYNIGYIEHERYFDKFENQNPGIFLSGNYRGGISVGDCIKNSDLVSNKVIQFLNNKN